MQDETGSTPGDDMCRKRDRQSIQRRPNRSIQPWAIKWDFISKIENYPPTYSLVVVHITWGKKQRFPYYALWLLRLVISTRDPKTASPSSNSISCRSIQSLDTTLNLLKPALVTWIWTDMQSSCF